MALYLLWKKDSVKFRNLLRIFSITLLVCEHQLLLIMITECLCSKLPAGSCDLFFVIPLPCHVLSSIACVSCSLFMFHSCWFQAWVSNWVSQSTTGSAGFCRSQNMFFFLACVRCVFHPRFDIDWKCYFCPADLCLLLCVKCLLDTVVSPGPRNICILLWHIFASKCLTWCSCYPWGVRAFLMKRCLLSLVGSCVCTRCIS